MSRLKGTSGARSSPSRLSHLDPRWGRELLVSNISRIQDPARLQQNYLGFIICGSAMLDAARNDDHFDRSQLHNPISELDATRTRQTRNISQHRRDGAIATAIRVAVAAGLCSVAGLLGGLFRGRRWLSCDLLLGFFYGMDQQTAQGTVLIMGGAQCRVGIFALSATLRRRSAHGRDHRRVGFDWYPAARLATGLDPHVLRLAFALFLATIAATVAYQTWRGAVRVEGGPRRAWGWITIFGYRWLFLGVFRSRRAFVTPPLLTTFFGLRQLEAQGLALTLVSPSALIALLAYAEAGRVDWVIGLPLALDGIAATSAGVKFASRLPERRMRWLSAVSC